MTTLRHGIRFACIAAVLLPGAQVFAQAPDVAATLARYRIQEHPAPLREVPGWRAPRKVVVLQYGPRWTDLARFRAAAPGVEFVAATSVPAAIAAVADADALLGFNPDICDARILSAARQLRWLASMSAGV